MRKQKKIPVVVEKHMEEAYVANATVSLFFFLVCVIGILVGIGEIESRLAHLENIIDWSILFGDLLMFFAFANIILLIIYSIPFCIKYDPIMKDILLSEKYEDYIGNPIFYTLSYSCYARTKLGRCFLYLMNIKMRKKTFFKAKTQSMWPFFEGHHLREQASLTEFVFLYIYASVLLLGGLFGSLSIILYTIIYIHTWITTGHMPHQFFYV